MKAENKSVVVRIKVIGLTLAMLALAASSFAETPDAVCNADSLYLISPEYVDLHLQNEGRMGMVLSWRDLDLSESTCYALTTSPSAAFEAEVTGGYGGMVDRSFVFSTADSGGTVGAVQAEPLRYNWHSDGAADYGFVSGVLNLANNGGIWRYDQGATSWGQMNLGLPMTWPQNNCVALDENSDGSMLAGFSTGSTTTISPVGLWQFRDGSWSRVAPEIFGSRNLVTKVAFQPGDSQRFAVGTATNGFYLTTDGGATFTNMTWEFEEDFEPQPTIYKVNDLLWTDSRLMVAIPSYGLFVSEDNGDSFSRSNIQVVQDLDKLRTVRTDGGSLGGEALRMRGTVDLDISGTGLLADYERTLSLDAVFEMHAAPRTAGAAVQDFAMELMVLDTRLVSDSEFELLQITAGDSLGMASPGNLTLTRQPDGTFLAEGYYDLRFQVDLEGQMRGPLEGYTGVTTGQSHFVIGDDAVGQACDLPPNGFGTADLPPQCEEGWLGHIQVTGGLPAGTTLEMDVQLGGYQEIMVLPIINELAEHPGNADHLLAAVNYHGVMESDDGGYTWHPLRGDLIVPDETTDGLWVRNALSVAFDSADEDVMVVALRQEGLYRTGDGGVTWIEVGNGVQPANLGSLINMAVRSDADRGGLFYAQEDKWSLLASSDGGLTWNHMTDQPVLNKSLVLEMAADGSGDLLSGTWGGGTYIAGTPLPLTETYNSGTATYLRSTLDLGLSIAFSRDAVSDADSLYLKCQTFQGWAVWRSAGGAREDMTLLGLYDRVNPESCIEGYCGDESYDIKPECFISKRAACFNFDTADTIRFFDDEVYNGFEYTYAVTSFDYGNTALTSPQNSSKVMVFSPRWQGDSGSPFSGDGNVRLFQVNTDVAPTTVASDANDIYVYPNPLRLGAGIKGYEGERVVFTNLPAESRIEIFTPAGDRIIELGPELQVGSNIHWDTRNSEGEELSAGVFLYKVTMAQRGDFWGKVVIIR